MNEDFSSHLFIYVLIKEHIVYDFSALKSEICFMTKDAVKFYQFFCVCV